MPRHSSRSLHRPLRILRGACSRLRAAKERDATSGTAQYLLLPRPQEARWGFWENYIIPVPGPELGAPIPALSARIQSGCHHSDLVLRKLKVAMLYGTTWPEARGEMVLKSCL